MASTNGLVHPQRMAMVPGASLNTPIIPDVSGASTSTAVTVTKMARAAEDELQEDLPQPKKVKMEEAVDQSHLNPDNTEDQMVIEPTVPVSTEVATELPRLPTTPQQYPRMENFDRMVRLVVGSGGDQEVFAEYKGVLSYYSGWFRDALNSEPDLPDKLITIELPNESPKVIVKALYFFKCKRVTNMGGHAFSMAWPDIIGLWKFGFDFSVPMLQNAAVEKMLQKTMHSLNKDKLSEHVAHIYEVAGSDSALRQATIACIAKTTSVDAVKESLAGWPKEAIIDLLDMTAGMDFQRASTGELKALRPVEICTFFHIHGNGEKCSTLFSV